MWPLTFVSINNKKKLSGISHLFIVWLWISDLIFVLISTVCCCGVWLVCVYSVPFYSLVWPEMGTNVVFPEGRKVLAVSGRANDTKHHVSLIQCVSCSSRLDTNADTWHSRYGYSQFTWLMFSFTDQQTIRQVTGRDNRLASVHISISSQQKQAHQNILFY